jgi:NAD(P)-dependent dehydrogenase (short-subunit alcohol dehydrogenase family)
MFNQGAQTASVLVTGCSSGVGRATALALARAGLPTWASARRIEALSDLEAAGCHIVALDVTDEQSRINAVTTMEKATGAVGALVNNAAYEQAGPIEEISLDMLRKQFETNVFGLVRLSQLVLPGMRERGHGTIVNMGSAAGLMSFPGSGAYAMTKWAIEALSDALRMEVKGFGIRVVLLEPGGISSTNYTTTADATWPAVDGPYVSFRQNAQRIRAQWYRPGAPGMSTPADVANVVVKAITSKRPRARYKIGILPRVIPWLYRTLPNRAWDAIWARQLPIN